MKHDEFNIAEIFSDSATGKTSAGKTTGIYLVALGSISYLATLVYAIITSKADIVNILTLSSTAVITMGTALIAGKIIKPSNPIENETTA